jgi:hypothetical protein
MTNRMPAFPCPDELALATSPQLYEHHPHIHPARVFPHQQNVPDRGSHRNERDSQSNDVDDEKQHQAAG